MWSHVSKLAYAPSPWLLQHRLSLYKARLSSCRTLSFDKPNMLPISNSVFSLPSSIPNRSLIIRLSFGLRTLRRFRMCLRIRSRSTLTVGVSTSVSAVISCKLIQNAFSDYGLRAVSVMLEWMYHMPKWIDFMHVTSPDKIVNVTMQLLWFHY